LFWKLEGKCANDKRLLAWTQETKNDFFMDKIYTKQAINYCKNGCPVLDQCLQEGLKHEPGSLVVPQGVWGGTSERDRRKLLRNLNKRLVILQEKMQTLLQDENFPNAS
jgi:hypothetical protein